MFDEADEFIAEYRVSENATSKAVAGAARTDA